MVYLFAPIECYELTRRIEAWNRLNKDALAITGPKNPFKSPFTFQPTTCSKCSPQVALALMSLLSAIFETSISQSESVVTPELMESATQRMHDTIDQIAFADQSLEYGTGWGSYTFIELPKWL